MRGKWHYGFSRPEYLPKARGFDDHAGYLQGACDHLTEETGCAVDSWRSDATYSGPDRRNNTGYDSWRHASDMVEIIRRPDPRPLFLYAALHGAKTAALTCACDAKGLSERVHVHSRAQPDRSTRRVPVDVREQPARLVHQEAEDRGDGQRGRQCHTAAGGRAAGLADVGQDRAGFLLCESHPAATLRSALPANDTSAPGRTTEATLATHPTSLCAAAKGPSMRVAFVRPRSSRRRCCRQAAVVDARAPSCTSRTGTSPSNVSLDPVTFARSQEMHLTRQVRDVFAPRRLRGHA